MDYELTIDYNRVSTGFKERFYFMENDVPVSTLFRSEVEARFSETVCYPHKSYVEVRPEA